MKRLLQEALQSLAEVYAEDGVERLAGKGWRELEKEEQLRADADIAGVPAVSLRHGDDQSASWLLLRLVSVMCARAARVSAINAMPFCIPFMPQATRRRHALLSLPSQSKPQDILPPPSPPPTPYCSLGEIRP